MFDNCAAFNQPIDFNTAQVTNMSGMFRGCVSLTQRPIFRNFNPQIVDEGMFDGTPLQPAQAAANPPILAAPNPGVAFEVHNVFDRINISTLLDLIQVPGHVDRSYQAPDFGQYVLDTLREFINNVPEDKRAGIQETLNDRLCNHILHFTYTSNHTYHVDGVAHTVLFGKIVDSVLAFVATRPPDRIAEYMETFTRDCVSAYATGPPSCARGVVERMVTSLGNWSGGTDANNPAAEQLYVDLAKVVGGVDDANPGASVLPVQVQEFAGQCISKDGHIRASLLAVDEANIEERKRLLKNCITKRLGLPDNTDIPAMTAYLSGNSAAYVLSNEFINQYEPDGGGRRRMYKNKSNKRTARRKPITRRKRTTRRKTTTKRKRTAKRKNTTRRHSSFRNF
jgi:hypothetical protein